MQAAAVVRQQHFLAGRHITPAKPQLRAFASSPLADVLKEELDYELDNDEKPEVRVLVAWKPQAWPQTCDFGAAENMLLFRSSLADLQNRFN